MSVARRGIINCVMRWRAMLGVVAGLSAGALPATAQTRLSVVKVADDFALMMGDFGNELGIFRKRGLDVEISLITQGKMVQAMIGGDVDMALASGATLAFCAKGAPLKGVAAIAGPPLLLVLVTRPDKSVERVEQLRGKTVAVTSVGSLTDWAVSQIVARQGWAPADIKRISVGDTPARVAALKTGAADAAVLDIAAALDLEGRGEAKILVRFGELISDFQNQIVFASDAAIQSKPEAVRAFVAGWLETVAYARGHRAETVAFAQKALNVDATVAGKVYDELIPANYLSADGRFNPKALAAMSKSFVELKLADHEADLSQYVTETFLPPAK